MTILPKSVQPAEPQISPARPQLRAVSPCKNRAMGLTREQLCEYIAGLHLDDSDVVITCDRDGLAVESVHGGPYVDDIGSSYEVPDSADEHGRRAFIAGPFTAYQYHSTYTAPHRGNYEDALDDLIAGNVRAVIVGYGVVSDNDAWVFGVRTEE